MDIPNSIIELQNVIQLHLQMEDDTYMYFKEFPSTIYEPVAVKTRRQNVLREGGGRNAGFLVSSTVIHSDVFFLYFFSTLRRE